MPESRPAPFPLRVLQDPEQARQELARVASRNVSSSQQQARSLVDGILEDVRQRGDAAVAEYTERFDRFRPVPIAVPKDDLGRAWRELPENLRDALDLAHRRIQEFHQRQRRRTSPSRECMAKSSVGAGDPWNVPGSTCQGVGRLTRARF